MSEKENYRMELIRTFKQKKPKLGTEETAKKNFKSLLRLALNDLVMAWNMAYDYRLPECLSIFAREITRTEYGLPFRPELRRLISDCIDDEKKAIELLEYLRKNENEIDQSLMKFLYPLLKTLTGRTNTELLTTKFSETSLR